MAPLPAQDSTAASSPQGGVPDEFYVLPKRNSARISASFPADTERESRPICELEKLDPCMMTDEERELLQRHKRRQDAFRTALCDTFRRSGVCAYGEGCRFAHTQEELRVPSQPRGRLHPKYKTVLCENFERDGICRYGQRCMYIHRRQGSSNNSFNTSLGPCDRSNPFYLKPDVVVGAFSRNAMGRRSVRGPSAPKSFDPNMSLPVFARGDIEHGLSSLLGGLDIFSDEQNLPSTSTSQLPTSTSAWFKPPGGNSTLRRMAPSPTNPVNGFANSLDFMSVSKGRQAVNYGINHLEASFSSASVSSRFTAS